MTKMYFNNVPVYIVVKRTTNAILVRLHNDALTEVWIPLSTIRSNQVDSIGVGDEDVELAVHDWFYKKEIAQWLKT